MDGFSPDNPQPLAPPVQGEVVHPDQPAGEAPAHDPYAPIAPEGAVGGPALSGAVTLDAPRPDESNRANYPDTDQTRDLANVMDAAGDADRQRVAINRDEKNELDFKGEPINTLPNLENKADAAYKKLMTVSNPHASSIEYDAAYDADLQARRAFDDANSTEGQYARRDFDRKSAEETFTKYGPQVTGSRTFNRQSRAMAYANRARELETLAGALHEHSVAPEFQAAHPDVEFTPQGLLRKQEEAWRLEEHAGKAADEAARSAISVEVPDVNEEVTLLASDDQKKRWGKALADFRQAEAAINSMIPELKQLRITQLEDQAQAIKGMLDAVMNGKTNEAISDVGTEPAPDVQEGGDLNVHPQPVESEGNGVDEDPSSFEA